MLILCLSTENSQCLKFLLNLQNGIKDIDARSNSRLLSCACSVTEAYMWLARAVFLMNRID